MRSAHWYEWFEYLLIEQAQRVGTVSCSSCGKVSCRCLEEHSEWAREYRKEAGMIPDVCACGTVGSSCPVHGEWQ